MPQPGGAHRNTAVAGPDWKPIRVWLNFRIDTNYETHSTKYESNTMIFLSSPKVMLQGADEIIPPKGFQDSCL